MIIDTAKTKFLILSQFLKVGEMMLYEIWVFDATRGISRYIKLPLIPILQMK